MTIEATRMPYDRVELHYAKATMYQEFELEGENRILISMPQFWDRRKKMMEKL